MLTLEILIFVRSHPYLSANLFEELERIEPYIEILEIQKGATAIHSKSGWSLIFRGKLRTIGDQIYKSGDALYHRDDETVEPIEPAILVFFSEESMQKFLRDEPELAIPFLEKMKALKNSEVVR